MTEPLTADDATPDHASWCYRRHTGDCVDGPSGTVAPDWVALADEVALLRRWHELRARAALRAPRHHPRDSMTPYTEAEDAALDAIEGTHAAHDDEPDPECADCQERAAELWDRMAGSY